MSASNYTLAGSAHSRVEHAYETVTLQCPDGRVIVIAWFYGDPAAAVIDRRERLCVVVGCGLLVYYLGPPFTPYRDDTGPPQWYELGHGPGDDWWLAEVTQVSDDTVRLVDEQGAAYELRVDDRSVRKLAP
jgi:hypothetical protein